MPYILNKGLISRLLIFLAIYYFYLEDLFIVFVADLIKIKNIPASLFVLLHQLALLILTVVLFGIYKIEIWNKLSPIPFRWRQVVKIFSVLLLISIAIRFLAAAGAALMPFFDQQMFDQAIKQQWGVYEKTFVNNYFTYFLALVNVVIISPIFEELFVRGVLYNALKSKLNIIISLFLSSLIFAVAHLSPIVIFHGLVTGIILTVVYEKMKNIWYPIFLHMTINNIPFLLPLLFWVARR